MKILLENEKPLAYELLTGLSDDLRGDFGQQIGLTGKMAAGARGKASPLEVYEQELGVCKRMAEGQK